jgi:GTP cyclohydrolase II
LEANISLGHGVDERSYGDAIEILKALDISDVELLTNNPEKLAAFEGSGIKYKGRKLQIVANEFNRKYLETKRDLLSHSLGEI